MRLTRAKPSWRAALNVARFLLLLLPGGIPIFLVASWLMQHQPKVELEQGSD